MNIKLLPAMAIKPPDWFPLQIQSSLSENETLLPHTALTECEDRYFPSTFYNWSVLFSYLIKFTKFTTIVYISVFCTIPFLNFSLRSTHIKKINTH